MSLNQSRKKKRTKPHSSAVANETVLGNKPLKAPRNLMRFYPWIVGCAFALIVYVVLYTGQSEFFFRSQELSLFLPTRLFFQEQMLVPGGFIVWLAAWFTQFFYYPWLGILILTALWVLVYACALRVFRVSSQWALWALVAPLALMAILTNLGYWLYHLKTLGYMYTGTLGILGVLFLLWIYRVLPGRFRAVWVVFAVAVGYPLLGAYALMAGGYMGLWALKSERNRIQRIAQPVIALLVGILVPVIWYYVYTQINYKHIYLAVLPVYIDPGIDFFQWVPYIILALSFLPLLLLGQNHPQEKVVKQPFYLRFKVLYALIQVCVVGACVYGASAFWYEDRNFRAEQFMHRAAFNEDWDAVIERAYFEQQEPTRLMVQLRNLALFRQGRAGDEMFRFPEGGARPNAAFDERMMQVGGKIVYLSYAKLNFCYRWCLEDAVEYGMKAEYLKYMAKCALYSGDKEIARKYLRTLKQTRFHAEWAAQYERMLDDPQLLAEFPEYKEVMGLYDYVDRLDGDQNLPEIYLLNLFSHTWSPAPLYQEMSMVCTLIVKDIPLFWPRFFEYVKTRQRIPVHYQEAAMLYCYLEKEYDPEMLPIDDAVKQRFQTFQNMLAQNQGKTEEMLEPLAYAQFGNTFWYFYFFVRNVKSN